MAQATLTISSKNYSSWSLRGWLLVRMAGLPFTETIISPDDPAMRAEILLLAPSMLVPCLTHKKVKVWDTLAIGEYLNEIKPDAGLLPADVVARAAGDGHTLLFTSALSTAAALYPTLPFDWQRDLSAIVQTTAGPQVLYVHPSLPVKTVKDLVAFALKRPGELGYASSGIGSVAHLSGASLGIASGLQLIHVPYKSNGLGTIDVIAGHVPIMFDQLSTAVPHVKAGKVRALAVTSGKRVASLPEVPTMIESGYKDFETTVWHGLMGPGSLQKDVLARINTEVNRVLKLAEVRERLGGLGLEVIGGTPEAFAAEMKRDHAWASRTIKAAGIKAE